MEDSSKVVDSEMDSVVDPSDVVDSSVVEDSSVEETLVSEDSSELELSSLSVPEIVVT